MKTRYYCMMSARDVRVRRLVGEVLLQVLGHAKGPDPGLGEDGLHLLVGEEVLLVLGVLQLLLPDVGPEPLHHLGPAQLLALLGPHQVRQVVAQVQRLGESASLGHCEMCVCVCVAI